MRRKPGLLRRLLSLNQHRKRFGAKLPAEEADLAAMKRRIIEAGAPKQTRGSEKSLPQHLENLRCEFSGQPELLYVHAELIVLIRRGYRTDESFARLLRLWEAEGDFLCQRLDLRWLVSACDSFAEHHPDPAQRAVAALVSLLTNSVKLYETERFITADVTRPDPARIDRLQTELVPLFGGLSCFTVGTDDTLRNLYWRLEPFFALKPAGPVLKAAWDRMQTEDTAFARLRALHRRERTAWWSD